MKISRTLLFLTVAAILSALALISPYALLGDVNGDNDVQAMDYMMVKRHVLGTFELTGENLANADINGDGEVQAMDYMMVKRHVLGTFEIVEPDEPSEPPVNEPSQPPVDEPIQPPVEEPGEPASLSFALNDWQSGYEVVGIGTYTDTNVIIPPTYKDKPVTAIASDAFANNSIITSVIIPDSVVDIGYYAFEGCTGLTSIVIPNSVTTIGDYAFYGCTGLISIVIPDSVTTIGINAFEGCTGLTSIVIPSGVTTIDQSTFYGCTNLESILVGEGNQSYYSQNNCLIEKETNALILGCKNSIIPDGVTMIFDYAFYGCTGLTSIVIPDSVIAIDRYTFYRCADLESILVGDGNQSYYSENNCLIEKETNTLILGCKNSIIPDSVTKIGDYAFYGCTGLTSIVIPDNVTEIGFYAFGGCSGSESILVGDGNKVYRSENNCLIEKEANTLILGCKNSIIPDSVTKIDRSAFRDCIGLTSLTIPDSVTEIGNIAFGGCTGLTSIVIPESVTQNGEFVFLGWSTDQIIYCEATSAPLGWLTGNTLGYWDTFCDAQIYWGDEWEYVDGVPTVK